MKKEFDISSPSISNIIVNILESIPSHHESPKEIDEICNDIIEKESHKKEVVYGMVLATLSFLDSLDVIDCDNNCFKMHGQIPHYFRNSLCWYISGNRKLFSNWNRLGASREMEISGLLDSAPHFLKLIEEKRLCISENCKTEPGHSRTQNVAICLVKTTYKGKVYFLHQWDTEASQYQIIGGKQRPGEDNFDTAKRELEEEIKEHQLVYKRDYEINKINEEPIKKLQVSPTYGALTLYDFSLYAVKLNLNNLKLSNIDKWISFEEVKKGKTLSDRKIRNYETYELFGRSVSGGLEGVPDSVNFTDVINFWKYVEIKPKLFGLISIDIKRFAVDVFKTINVTNK